VCDGLAGFKVTMMAGHSRLKTECAEKLSLIDMSAYGLLITFELQLWDHHLLATIAKAPGSSTDGHINQARGQHTGLHTGCS
jgi:hypothetical protein